MSGNVQNTAALSVDELAALVGGTVEGDGAALVRGVAGLREALPGDCSFLANPRYAAQVAATQATVVLVRPDFEGASAAALIRVADPDAAFAQVAMRFVPEEPVYPKGVVHPTAVVDAAAQVGADCYIGPHCVVEPGAVLGDGCVLVAQCYVGHEVTLGAGSRLYPMVTVREGCRLGERVILHSGAVIGGDGFGYSVDADGVRTKIPQRGIVELGDDVEVGAGSTIDRARFGRTVIGRGVKIDNLVMIAHNCVIGDHAVIVAQVGISGSTTVGAKSILAGQVGVVGHVSIGPNVVVEARSVVTKDIPAGEVVMGFPAVSRMAYARSHAEVQRLPKLKQKVAELEARLRALEAVRPADD